MLPSSQTLEGYIQLLQAGDNLPKPTRTELINLFRTLLTMVPPTTKLVQCDIVIPDPALGDDGKSHFPHLVVFKNGARSADDEACLWEQYKTKQTHIKVRLHDAQGAPPPRSCPM